MIGYGMWPQLYGSFDSEGKAFLCSALQVLVLAGYYGSWHFGQFYMSYGLAPTVIISGKPNGHGSSPRTLVEPIIRSLYRVPCPPHNTVLLCDNPGTQYIGNWAARAYVYVTIYVTNLTKLKMKPKA